MKTINSFKDFLRKDFVDNKICLTDNNGKRHITSLFNVYRREEFLCKSHSNYSRRDYYKITLLVGSGILYYADKAIDINRNALLFSNPNVPYA